MTRVSRQAHVTPEDAAARERLPDAVPARVSAGATRCACGGGDDEPIAADHGDAPADAFPVVASQLALDIAALTSDDGPSWHEWFAGLVAMGRGQH